MVASEREDGEAGADAHDREARAEAESSEAVARSSAGTGAIELDFPRGRALRLAIAGALLGFPGLGLWSAFLVPTLLARSLSEGAETALIALVLPITLAISIVLPPWLLRSRQPRAARVTWDRWGATEHDGAHVRTAIPWSAARARVETGGRGRVVQITDAEGRAITVAAQGATPRWLARRKASAPEASVEELARALAERELGPPIEPDARDRRRPTMGPQAWSATLVIGVLGVAMLWVVEDLRHLAPAFVALIVCMLCAAPALRPLHELLDLLATARRFDRAEEATIEQASDGGAEDASEVVLRRKDGSLVRVDLAPARHPDARLATREGTLVHVALPESGWVPAVKIVDLGAAIAASAVETAHDREVRGELARAAGIELAVRALAVAWWGVASLSPVWR